MSGPRRLSSVVIYREDWRVGRRVQGKYVDTPFYGKSGIVNAVGPTGTFGIEDHYGVLFVRMEEGSLAGEVIVTGADKWVTA